MPRFRVQHAEPLSTAGPHRGFNHRFCALHGLAYSLDIDSRIFRLGQTLIRQ
jgi:hypothetical protein